MQETGIVRRIDELGRVVIPKEMRKTLRIKEGDPLEIYTDKDKLVLKKYSPISSVTAYAQAVADGIEELTEKVCVVTDNDTLIYTSKGKMKENAGKTVSKEISKILDGRKSVVVSKADGGNIINVVDGDNFGAENQIIVPIVSGGDCFGSIIVFDKNKASRFNSSDVKFVQLGASFLSKQFE